ncbi:hypothetical protein MBBA_0389 [Methanoculleus bourgensis]|jgi:glutaredoxin|uniref:Glutaredoxin-like protein (Modular protein) n=2 Tax=Methanomicrobiaceae TaxID=2194 RepID=A0A0X3BJG5_9EURY|nr:hypothetical protein MBOURGENBZM_04620 [Methanoculleus bourgensis]CVK31635.1 Glutaredoxin-like protein (modular protein) [Methanoculleus bourgensis]SAI87270.1 hypothetical protein MBBA_0389 [Methanoculleus bourgensis]
MPVGCRGRFGAGLTPGPYRIPVFVRPVINGSLQRMRADIFDQRKTITIESGGIIISDTTQFIVYTLEFCPNCEILKEFLASRGVPFVECDMASAEALTELRMNGIFVQEAPVLQKGDAFYTSGDLFAGGAFQEDLVADLIAEA